jgi:hypothetical protein
MGSPLMLTSSGNALGTGIGLQEGEGNAVTGVHIGEGSPGTEGASSYTLTLTNASGGGERLQIINSASPGNTGAATSTWINVTTSHSRADLINLAGTVVLAYDISGPAGDMSSTDINVFVTSDGNNATDNLFGSIDIVTAGNVRAGVYDLCGTPATFGCLNDADTTAVTGITFGKHTPLTASSGDPHAGTSAIVIAFEITHAAGNQLTDSHDFAITADFCNFDQNNGSLTHNCIYRLNAVETGDDTGVFTGTVEYVNMVNSTAGTSGGGHAGGNAGVAGYLGNVKGDSLSVVLQNSVSGSDSVRVVYNDTDRFHVATLIGAQLESSTVTGTISLNSDNYGSGDIGTITIVDNDLNQDSSIRDTYTNSSTTFTNSIYKSGSTTETAPFANIMTVIETGADTGVFVGSFIVPDRLGADMKLTYYESRDAAGSAVTYETNATISSNSGSVELDRSVYPVPFTSGDLRTGNANESLQTEGGAVTAWITVSHSDDKRHTDYRFSSRYNLSKSR